MLARRSRSSAPGRSAARWRCCAASGSSATSSSSTSWRASPKGKALDLQQTRGVLKFDVDVTGGGTTDYANIAGADVCIVTAGVPRKPGMSRDDLLEVNLEAITKVAQGIKQHAPNAFVIVVTNPLDAMVYAMQQGHRLPEEPGGRHGRRARHRALPVLRRARRPACSPQDVAALVLGGHGDDMVPARRATARWAASRSRSCSTKAKLDAIVERTRKGGGEIVALLETGSAFYAPAASRDRDGGELPARPEARARRARRYLEGEYGCKDLFVGVPVVIGAGGVEKVIELELDDDEKAMLAKSVESREEVGRRDQALGRTSEAGPRGAGLSTGGAAGARSPSRGGWTVSSLTTSAPSCGATPARSGRRARRRRSDDRVKIHEYQAKEILRKFGVAVPRGYLAVTPAEAEGAARQLGGGICVVKAQIHAGGRGKGGGVKVASAPDEARAARRGDARHEARDAADRARRGRRSARSTSRRAAASRASSTSAMTLDREAGRLAVMASTEGGMEIEEVAHEHARRRSSASAVDPVTGLMPYQARRLAFGARAHAATSVSEFVAASRPALYDAYVATDASLAEINPLVVTDGRRGARARREDELRRQRALPPPGHRRACAIPTRRIPSETQAKEYDLAYIALDGDIGCMVNGAGLAMATMDIIKLYGGAARELPRRRRRRRRGEGHGGVQDHPRPTRT